MKSGDKGRDGGEYGLWLNILHVMTLLGWNQSQLAALLYPYTDEASIEQLQHKLNQVLRRRQTRWKYSAVLADALGLPEHAVLAEDLRRYGTLASLHRYFGFSRHDISRRYVMQQKKKWIPSNHQAVRSFNFDFLLGLDDGRNDEDKGPWPPA